MEQLRQLERRDSGGGPVAPLRALAPGGHVANNNDIAGNPLFYGIFFYSLAPSYDLQGDAIQLSGDVLNQSGANQTIGLNIHSCRATGRSTQTPSRSTRGP